MFVFSTSAYENMFVVLREVFDYMIKNIKAPIIHPESFFLISFSSCFSYYYLVFIVTVCLRLNDNCIRFLQPDSI